MHTLFNNSIEGGVYGIGRFYIYKILLLFLTLIIIGFFIGYDYSILTSKNTVTNSARNAGLYGNTHENDAAMPIINSDNPANKAGTK